MCHNGYHGWQKKRYLGPYDPVGELCKELEFIFDALNCFDIVLYSRASIGILWTSHFHLFIQSIK